MQTQLLGNCAMDRVYNAAQLNIKLLRLANTTFATLSTPYINILSGGVDDQPSDGAVQNAYSLFANADEVDVSLVITGNASVSTQQYVIDNIANARKDCIATVGAHRTNLVAAAGGTLLTSEQQTTNVLSYFSPLTSSSYATFDCGYKYCRLGGQFLRVDLHCR